MKTIRAIIVDDEPLAHQIILKYAERIPFLQIVGQSYLATEAYDLLNGQSVDLIFLDMDMPMLKGLEFLRTLLQKPAIIITSAHEAYALEGFELQVADYLLKPFRFERFLQAINKVQAERPQSQDSSGSLFIKVDKKQVQIELSSVQYIESYGNYVKVWIAEKYYLTPKTLSGFSALLPSDFHQVHKSYVVQRSFIKYVEGNQVTMANGNVIPIGKSYRNILKSIL